MPHNLDDQATNPESTDDYRLYVEHPRFGRGPRLTGLNPALPEYNIHWHSRLGVRIPNTAVAAVTSKQAYAAGDGSWGSPIPYYFDARRVCRDCKRPFIFFAEEQ